MIHIIDPRVTPPDPMSRFSTFGGQRHIPDRLIFHAAVVAVRQPSGRYKVIKARWAYPVPKRPVTYEKLLTIIQQALEIVDEMPAPGGTDPVAYGKAIKHPVEQVFRFAPKKKRRA